MRNFSGTIWAYASTIWLADNRFPSFHFYVRVCIGAYEMYRDTADSTDPTYPFCFLDYPLFFLREIRYRTVAHDYH